MSPVPPGVPRVPPPPGAVPAERGRALGVLGGMALFVVGMAVAGIFAMTGHGGSPGYLIAVTCGFLGIGAVGLFIGRGSVPLPPGPLWSPSGLAFLCRGAGLPARAVQVGLYLLALIGVVTNLGVPLLRR